MAALRERLVCGGALDFNNLETRFTGVGKHRKEANLVRLEQDPINGEHERAIQSRLLRVAQLAAHYRLGYCLDAP